MSLLLSEKETEWLFSLGLPLQFTPACVRKSANHFGKSIWLSHFQRADGAGENERSSVHLEMWWAGGPWGSSQAVGQDDDRLSFNEAWVLEGSLVYFPFSDTICSPHQGAGGLNMTRSSFHSSSCSVSRGMKEAGDASTQRQYLWWNSRTKPMPCAPAARGVSSSLWYFMTILSLCFHFELSTDWFTQTHGDSEHESVWYPLGISTQKPNHISMEHKLQMAGGNQL